MDDLDTSSSTTATAPPGAVGSKLQMPLPSGDTALVEFACGLLRKMDITKGVRFDSHRRLQQRHAVSHLAISTLSVYVICVALLELLVTTQRGQLTELMHYLFPLATIIAPIFILVMEKHLAGEQYLVMADRMERSAQKIQQLHSRLHYQVAGGSLTWEKLNEAREEYEEILYDFAGNHDNIDYFYFRSLHPEKFEPRKGWNAIRQHIRGRGLHLVNVWGVPLFLIVVPGSMIVLLVLSILR